MVTTARGHKIGTFISGLMICTWVGMQVSLQMKHELCNVLPIYIFISQDISRQRIL